LTSIHTFDIEETVQKPQDKKDNSSDSEPEQEDSDDKLANQAGGLNINNQIREAEIPRELTP